MSSLSPTRLSAVTGDMLYKLIQKPEGERVLAEQIKLASIEAQSMISEAFDLCKASAHLGDDVVEMVLKGLGMVSHATDQPGSTKLSQAESSLISGMYNKLSAESDWLSTSGPAQMPEARFAPTPAPSMQQMMTQPQATSPVAAAEAAGVRATQGPSPFVQGATAVDDAAAIAQREAAEAAQRRAAAAATEGGGGAVNALRSGADDAIGALRSMGGRALDTLRGAGRVAAPLAGIGALGLGGYGAARALTGGGGGGARQVPNSTAMMPYSPYG